MTAPDNTSLQANYKLASGDLINVYGKDAFTFKANLEALADLAQQVLDTGNLLRGASTVVDAGLTGHPAQPAPPQQPQPDYTPQGSTPSAGPVPQCAHGPRTHRKGNGAKGEWQAYFCPQPKGQPQCEALWLRKGEPGWVY